MQGNNEKPFKTKMFLGFIIALSFTLKYDPTPLPIPHA